MERPSKGLPIIACTESQVTAGCHHIDFEALTTKEINDSWLVSVLVVSETELSLIVTAPCNEPLRVFKEHKIAILCCHNLLYPQILLLQRNKCLLGGGTHYDF